MKKVPILLLLLGLMVFFSQCFVMTLDGSTITSWSSSKKSAQGLRIIALNSDSLEALRILNAQDMVVGIVDTIAQEKKFFGNLADLPVVGRWMEPNYEKIYSLRPDILISYKSLGPELEKKLEGIRILRKDLYKPFTLNKEIKDLGKILNKTPEAMDYIHWYKQQLDKIKNYIANSKTPRPKVYMECYSPYQALGPGSGGYSMGKMAGGDNVSSKLKTPYSPISSEWLLKKQPRVIVKTSTLEGYSLKDNKPFRKLRQKIVSRPGWKEIKAVANDRVYILSSGICAGPRAIIGTAYMARWFYPKSSSKLQPKKMHKEYLKRFQGQEYQGCFAWPSSSTIGKGQ